MNLNLQRQYIDEKVICDFVENVQVDNAGSGHTKCFIFKENKSIDENYITMT